MDNERFLWVLCSYSTTFSLGSNHCLRFYGGKEMDKCSWTHKTVVYEEVIISNIQWTWNKPIMRHYSFSVSKYFHLLIAPIKGFILWLDNEIDRKINVTAKLFLLVQNRQQTWLDQALMDSTYRSGADYVIFQCTHLPVFELICFITASNTDYNWFYCRLPPSSVLWVSL